MRWTRYFMPTSKEAPKDAETISHKLMFRAGLVDKTSSGVYTYLPAGYKVLRKVEGIVRDEMNKAGAVELLMPALQPASLWKESGRLEKMGDEMIRFTDRHKRLMVFGPTHEEVITDIVRRYINSWKQLPVTLYQIQTKFRDEMRPRFGIVRAREFLMKDAYSFDLDEKGLDETYLRMKEAYKNIFTRSGLVFSIQQADSGVIGGKFSEEFVAEGECPELEVGHLFKLGKEYSEAMKAVFVNREGKEQPAVMGCYGIGVSRIVAAAVEGNYDEKGIIWPLSIAPFSVLVIPVKADDPALREAADKIYGALTKNNVEVLLDDREGSAGFKFSDADLTGIPLWVVIGKKFTENGKAEIKIRRENRFVEVEIDNAAKWISDYLKEHGQGKRE
ncbi:MAG: proline--tRNA ligase [Candidatus Omnitrophica bacterium]|nr:proline--tRNA ligase [Candidatus Omnitrophota bacterium]